MKKLVITIFYFLAVLLHADLIKGYAQVEMIGDTIKIQINGYKGGIIQWQFSSDKNTWNNLANSSSKVFFTEITETGFYRAKIIYKDCNYFSDTTFVIAAKPTTNLLFQKDIFIPQESGYACFRIPTIIKAKNNRIIAIAEGRKIDCGDHGDIDIVSKYSDDFGYTWSQLKVIWSDNLNTCGNPSPVYDAINEVIWLICSWNNGKDHENLIMQHKSIDQRRVYKLSSIDNGITWSYPSEITQYVKKDYMGWYATGPCHGIQITNSQKKGRLIIPCDHSKSTIYYSHIIYSDDFGANWSLGGIVPTRGQNESTIAEIPDGKLILSCRNYDGSLGPYRTLSYSGDFGSFWSEAKPAKDLIEPICQGSLLGYSNSETKKFRLYFSNPSDRTTRINLKVKISEDYGKTWSDQILVNSGPSSYSDLVKPSDKTLGIVYENGINKPIEKITYCLLKVE